MKTITVGKRTFTILFPDAFRALNAEEATDLKSSVKAHGVMSPVIADENDGLIDGIHRVTYAAELGLTKIPVTVLPGLDLAQKRAIADTLNRDRRHLTAEERRRVVAEELKADPEQSDRKIAEKVGVSGHTVAAVREEKESVGEIPQVGKRQGRDEKSYPATKNPPAEEASGARSAHLKPDVSAETSGSAPPKKGKSPPILCDRCQRIGTPVKDCQACKIAGEEAKRVKGKAASNGQSHEPTPPPEPETPPAPESDDLGIPIQPHAREAFEAREMFEELLSLLRKADRLYSQIAEHPGGAYLIRPGISVNARDRWKHAGIQTAILNVMDCRPAITVCPRAYHLQAFPDCKDKTPHGDDCSLCHGLNWSRPLGKNEVSPEVLAKAKEAHGV